MGQKSNPIGLRLQINRTWDSRWYAEGRNYSQLLKEDIELRKHIIESLPQAAISKVVIERPAKLCRISIYAARPGVIIGKKGADIEKLRAKLATMTDSEVKLNIVEIRKPEIDAKLVAQGVADQLIRRVAFRRAMKRAVQSALRLGAEGIRITCGGRLGGAEIAHAARERRLCRGRSAHCLWRDRHQVLDLQGRDLRPRSDGAGPPDDGGSDLRRPAGTLILGS